MIKNTLILLTLSFLPGIANAQFIQEQGCFVNVGETTCSNSTLYCFESSITNTVTYGSSVGALCDLKEQYRNEADRLQNLLLSKELESKFFAEAMETYARMASEAIVISEKRLLKLRRQRIVITNLKRKINANR